MRHLALASLAAALLALGCVYVQEHDAHPEPKGGPPPWAPAHGYRQKHPGPELVWNADIGVYVVVGFPHIYFEDGHYFRRMHSHWERCRDFEKARWQEIDVAEVPTPLAAHYAKKGKGHAYGHGAAKHDDDDSQ